MGKLAILIIILFLAALAVFAVQNNDATTVDIPFYGVQQISKIGLVLISTASGALVILLVFAIRDTRRFIATYHYQKRQKKEEKIHSLYSKAANAILAESDAEARDALEDILKEEPEHTDALLRLGDVSYGTGRYEDAFGYYMRAFASNPKNLEVLFSLEKVKERTGRWAEAISYIDEILEIDPDNMGALHKKRYLLEKEGRWHDLMEVQKSAMKHARNDRERQEEQAVLLGYRYEAARDSLEKGELEKANKGFRSIIREDKHFVPAYLGVAESMLQEGESEAAVSFLEKGYEQAPSMLILARLEDMLIGLGEPSRLIRLYRTAISRSPQDATLKFFLGKLYYRLEMVDDAFETLSSLDTAESYPELNQLMGELHMRMGQCDRAVEEFRKSMDSRKTLRFPYCCGSCGHFSEEWSGRCPSCGKWNTYKIDVHGTCKVQA
jgi:lipopolysaccharide biosynthesis regulator YciM